MADNASVTAQGAILVGVAKSTDGVAECEKSLDELARLLDTAGGFCYARLIQVKDKPDVRTYIGSGKVAELAELAEAGDIGLIVFDTELSPSQIQNLEEDIGDVSVIDRSMLILDIFALHAQSNEGKIQVELAQLKYTAPRLMGKGSMLSRLGGGIGTRGPGESQLERDRRHMRRRIHALESEIEEMAKNRSVMRAARDRSGLPLVAIVGYTNAGKSTLLNRLTDAGVLSEDKLFATLDPTTRRLSLPEGESLLLTDTVGLIRHLPHHLIEAFRSTLDEAAEADVLLIVADATDDECDEQLAVTIDLLNDLGASGKPTVLAYNKCDRENAHPRPAYVGMDEVVAISAATGEGVDTLLAALLRIVRNGKKTVTLVFPYAESATATSLYRYATVLSTEYGDEGITVRAVMDARALGMYKSYVREE